MPNIVAIGVRLARSTCRVTTRHSEMPLARAVLMKSSRSTSRTEARVIRAYQAA